MRNLLNLPKFDLHLHMEGAIPLESLFELQIGENPSLDFENFKDRFNFQHFGQFIELWCEHQTLLFKNLSPEQILPPITQAIAKNLSMQKVIYAEAHISPIDSLFMRYGKDDFLQNQGFYEEVLLTWDQAVDSLNSNPEMPRIHLIVDLVRNYPKEVFNWQVGILQKLSSRLKQVIGVGLGGGGTKKRLIDFFEGFQKLKQNGFKIFMHAGELPPAEKAVQEVKDALEVGVHRIGHGIQCYGDRNLLDCLVQKSIPLEVCPTSNLKTGSIKDLVQHPFPELFTAGVPIVIGSDDPTYFGTNLNSEYEKIQNTFGLVDSDILKLFRNSYQYSFAPEHLKREALEGLANGYYQD